MKPSKKILILDDKDQTREIESIQEDLDDAFDIQFKGIWTSDKIYRKDGTNDPDIEKLKNAISGAYDEFCYFDLILSDYDLNAKGIVDGIDLIEYIKVIKPKAKILMYSGNYTDAVRKLIKNPKGNLTEIQIAEAVSKFINYKLVDCVDRTSYRERTKKFLKGEKEISIAGEFIKLLNEHGDMIFNSCCPKFKGKKFSEIAQELDKGNSSYTDEWVIEMIRQTVAYLIDVNRL